MALHRLVERHRLETDVAVGLELRVDRNQVVDAAHLDAMAGIIEHRPIGAVGGVAEAAERVDQPVAVEVVGERHVEPGLLQRRLDQGRVARRVGQPRHVLIRAIADDERHPPLRLRGTRGEDETGDERHEQSEGTHFQ